MCVYICVYIYIYIYIYIYQDWHYWGDLGWGPPGGGGGEDHPGPSNAEIVRIVNRVVDMRVCVLKQHGDRTYMRSASSS